MAYNGLETGTGGHVSMGYNNPAFKIRIVAYDTSIQQPRGTDKMMGLSLNSTIDVNIDNKVVTGTVSKIVKNKAGDGILFIELTTKNGKKIRVDYSRLLQSTKFPHIENDNVSTPGVIAEHRILRYDEFLKSL